MGGCLSRKKESSSSSSSSLNAAVPVSVSAASATTLKGDLAEVMPMNNVFEQDKLKKQVEEESLVKKEIFVIKHRKSHDKERPSVPPPPPQPQKDVPPVEENWAAAAASTNSTNTSEIGSNVSNVVIRTSSCTKEEVDAILIQCGRLSRSNSSGAGKAATSGRKYAGSKRSYDLDQDQDQDVNQIAAANTANYDGRKRGNGLFCNDDEEDEKGAERRQHRQRHRQSGRPSPSSSQGRRRTPSRERDQRSGSRERGNGSSSTSGRRVSRSPGRRSENNPAPNYNNTTANANNAISTNTKPGKMVSVPATVSSLTMDKSNNEVEPETAAGIKRISVKRNVGEAAVAGSRTAASPRSQSPARTNVRGGSNENSQPSLSRSSSRKAEQSPYRRNPLSEIDLNFLVYAQVTGNNKINNGSSRPNTKNRGAEAQLVVKEVLNQAQMQKPNAEANNIVIAQGTENKIVKEQIVIAEDAKAQTLTRSRSARRSRDLDFNPETLLNTNPSYTALLLEDIQNFHQKNTNINTPAFSVPPCVAKASSILEAVADLNSTTSSNLSCAFVEDRRSPTNPGGILVGKKLADVKDPFVESEIRVSDDLMEPSLHKYVTMRRGGNDTLCGEDMDGQESSGSNSFVGGSQQHWGYSTSSWEPNSEDSIDRWTSSSNTREDDEKSPLGFQKHGCDMEEARRGFSGQRTGIGRGRVGSSKNIHSTPVVAAAAST